MKKWFLFPVVALSLAFSSGDEGGNSCNGYMLMEKGVTLVYNDYDAKDAVVGSRSSTVTNITNTGSVISVTIHSISKDKKDKVESEMDVVFTCENGIIKMDMKSMMNQEMMSEMEGMEITIEQTDLEMPASFTEGQTLTDGNITMTVSSGGMQIMKMVTSIVERKVEKLESITTPAGSYPCVKISQIMKTEMMGRVTQSKSVDWFSMGVGSVRSEHYDDKGVLTGYSVLTQVIR